MAVESPADAGVPGLTGAYYDRLSLWNRVARWIGYGGGQATLTVHRALADPRAGGLPTATRLHDLLVAALPTMTDPRVLDAGCGLGGTMIDLAARLGGRHLGVTLSASQVTLGTDAVARAGLADRVQLVVQSYDAPPGGPFDLVVAIESLAHSPDPAHSVAALSRQLAPGGVIAIVDDMPRSDRPAGRDLTAFKRGWRCPVLFQASEYRAHLEAGGLQLLTDRDLTSSVVPRPAWRIAALQALNRLAWHLLPSAGWRALMESHHGGLALERLYRQGHMEYRLLVAQRVAQRDE